MTNEQAYRDEWASKTGRAPSDIYIPQDIRDDEDDSTWPGKNGK